MGRGVVRARAAGFDTVVATSVVPTATITVQAWPVGAAQQTVLLSTVGAIADVDAFAPLRFGPSSQFLYFTQGVGGGLSGWRIATDGTGLSQVTEPGAAVPPFAGSETSPSPDPAGTTVIYDSNLDGVGTTNLRTRVLGSGVVTPLGLAGQTPRWSLDGTRIGYRDDQFRLVVAQPNGANPTVTSGRISAGFSWSPDSRWIVAAIPSSNPQLVLVDTQTGMNLPMYLKPPGALTVGKPAWKPTP